jgi:hypothetical protein
MTDDLQPGEEWKGVWLAAQRRGHPDHPNDYWIGDKLVTVGSKVVVRKSPPSEHSETAELERKVVAAARSWAMEDGMPATSKTLFDAVVALDAALAPPSLEEQIKAELELLAKCSEDATIGKAAVDVSLRKILEAVKAHES